MECVKRIICDGIYENCKHMMLVYSDVQPEMDTNNRVAGMLLKISSVIFVLADATEPLFEP